MSVVFHAAGVFVILQDSIMAKVFGAFWLVFTVLFFDLWLYEFVKEKCFVSDAQINQVDFAWRIVEFKIDLFSEIS